MSHPPLIWNPWTKEERRVLRRLETPMAIQEFLDAVPYCGDDNYRCPRSMLREGKGHCYDGAVFAAAALRELGHPPVLLELIPNRRDDDHILALFRRRGCWGAVAKSNFSGLRYREPVYRTVRELVMSYYEGYFNLLGERTLRGYGAPLHLRRFDRSQWTVRDAAMDDIAAALGRQRRHAILMPAMIKDLTKVDGRLMEAGRLGMRVGEVFKPTRR